MPKEAGRVEFSIVRDKEGLAKMVYTRYNLFYEQCMQFLLGSQKQNLIGSAHYNMTMNQYNASRKTAGYLGKLRGYKEGKEYNLYGEGENPERTHKVEFVRSQLAGIKYVTLC